MVRPPKMAVLLLSCTSPADQYLLHLYPTHLTNLHRYLPTSQLVIVLIKGAVRGGPLCWFPC